MKIAKIDNPVTSIWLTQNGLRLDSSPYLSEAVQARATLEKFSDVTIPLKSITRGFNSGIYNGPQFVRNYVNDPKYGVPFLTSGTMLLSDLSRVGLLRKQDASSQKLSYLRISQGMTLITCSGTVGRMTYAGEYMEGVWSSQDILKVVPNPDEILPGYLYAYLSSKFGVPQVTAGTYGAIIQHIEPQHIKDLPVPRLAEDIEKKAHQHIAEAAQLRTKYQTQIKDATALLFTSVGLQDITASQWHAEGPDLGFSQAISSPASLRALNFNPRLQKLLEILKQTNHMTLGEVCDGGQLRSGQRFKRIDCEPEFGVKLIGQRELFWMEPEGRWIAPQYAPQDIFVEDETILLAAQGTLGEHEVFCRVEFINGPWVEYVYSQHFIRIKPGNGPISGAFLFAFLRSEMVFRCLRSMSVGSKQQDLHRSMLAQLPVPFPDESTRKKIEELVRNAFKARHEASRLEKEAVHMVEEAIERETQ
jgi:type I restriction enzyme S subunit